MMSLKRKSEASLDSPEETKPRHLVMCFTLVDHDDPNPIFYKFEFYPIEKFITEPGTRGKLEPDAHFTWEEKLDKEYEKLNSKDRLFWREKMEVSPSKPHHRTCAPPYCDMRFLNVGDSVYAVGGHRIGQVKRVFEVEDLPKDFTRISLSEYLRNSKVTMENLRQMNGRKYISDIVEFGGLIYVLSPPTLCYPTQKPYFEVYDPSKDEWVSLPDPPFFDSDSDTVAFIDESYQLKCIVIGARLYAWSDCHSSVYDTNLKKWEACDLFSDFNPGFKGLAGCGPPFPFLDKPIVYKEKFLLATTLSNVELLLAFHINDEKRAVPVPFEFIPPITYGFTQHQLVDLGDDYFIAMLYDQVLLLDDAPHGFVFPDDCGDTTAVTFKLQRENGDDGFILKAKIVSMQKIKSSIGNPWKGGLSLDLAYAFVHHSSIFGKK